MHRAGSRRFGRVESGGGSTRWVKWWGYAAEDANEGDVSSPPEGKVARSIGSARAGNECAARLPGSVHNLTIARLCAAIPGDPVTGLDDNVS